MARRDKEDIKEDVKKVLNRMKKKWISKAFLRRKIDTGFYMIKEALNEMEEEEDFLVSIETTKSTVYKKRERAKEEAKGW